tara:strand:- start:25 stop:729 length:705 start_codon:yes stop_codon:yes gene_type:complete
MGKISVVFPTRKRAKLLKKSIDSLIKNANNFEKNVELIIGMDLDDSKTISEVVDIYKDFKNISMIITKRYGYQYMHEYINRLCTLSSGDWLFLWNDDCTIESKDWDLEILKYDDSFVVINPSVINGPFGGLPFPVLPKEWFDVVGHFSLNCSCDTWIQEILEYLKKNAIQKDLSVYTKNIAIHHDRCEETGNNDDETYRERVYDDKVFYSLDSMNQRIEDAITLSKYLSENYGA